MGRRAGSAAGVAADAEEDEATPAAALVAAPAGADAGSGDLPGGGAAHPKQIVETASTTRPRATSVRYRNPQPGSKHSCDVRGAGDSGPDLLVEQLR